MGKKSSKKYSFKGQRIIGNDKSNYSKSKLNSDSEGSTTDDMLSVLESDVHVNNNNKINNLAKLNNISTPLINKNEMFDMPQMGMPQMDMPQMGMPQMGMPQMGMPQMDMSQMGMPQMDMSQMGMPQMGMPQMGMPQMGMPQMGMPQMMGANDNIDGLMVNNLVPMNINRNSLLNPSQMANNLGSLAKLSNSNDFTQISKSMNQLNMGNNNFKNLANLK